MTGASGSPSGAHFSWSSAPPVLLNQCTSIDASDLRITLKVNGELKQDSRTSDLLFDVPHLVSELSKAFTFEPGDIIMTGTPSGVGPIKPGDVMEVEIEGLGVLANVVGASD